MTEILPFSEESLDLIVSELRKERPVALPTETVYGLAGNAFSERAVSRIFSYKERPKFDPLIVHGLHDGRPLDYIKKYELADFSLLSTEQISLIDRLLGAFSPGPLTVLLPKGLKVMDMVTSGLSEVALRFPSHKMFKAVLEQIDFPLAAPSANKFSYTSPTRPEHVTEQAMVELSYVLDGGLTDHGIESTVIRVRDDEKIEVLRPGSVTIEDLSGFAETIDTFAFKEHLPQAPGMLKKHYAPRKPAFRFDSIEELQEVDLHIDKDLIILDCQMSRPSFLQGHSIWFLSEDGRPDQAARNIFDFLNRFSSSEFDRLFVVRPSSREGVWLAIQDKIDKATKAFTSQP